MKVVILIAFLACTSGMEIGMKPQVVEPQVTVSPVVEGASKKPEIPLNVQTIVEMVHKHVPEVIKHHKLAHKQELPKQVGEQVAQVGVVPVTPIAVGHVPQVPVVPHVVGDKVVPPQVQNVVQHVQQHIPQVISHHKQQHLVPQAKPEVVVAVATGDDVPIPVIGVPMPDVAVPLSPIQPIVADKIQKLKERVQSIMHVAQTHIPQVINHHIAEQKKKQQQAVQQQQVPQSVPVVAVGADKVPQVVTEMPVVSDVKVPQVVPL